MSTESLSPPEARTYGNWRKAQTAGLWGLGTGSTLTLIGGITVGGLILLFGGLIPAVVWGLGLTVVAAGMLARDFSGRPYARTVSTQLAYANAKRKGQTVTLVGGLTPATDAALPGILGTTRLGEYVDPRGRLFSMISYRDGHHTIPFECHPNGIMNVDQGDVDLMVARYGQWLAQHGETQGLVAAEIIIETAPDSGQQLAHTLTSQSCESPPPVSKIVMDKIGATYPSHTATVRAFASVTFAEKGRLHDRKGKIDVRADAMARSLAPDIAVISDRLRGTGAGTTNPLDNQGLCEVMRVSYDPHAAEALDSARLNGDRPYSLGWGHVGPVAQDDRKEVYYHDGCWTITHVMTIPPRSTVTEDVLNRLLAPSTDARILRKRVAIKYWPIPLEKVADTAEKDHTTAVFQRNAAGRKTSSHHAAVDTTLQATHEVSRAGAGLSGFAIVVSMTVGREEDIVAARDALRILPPTARLKMRPCYGYMAAGAAATLPVGFDPNRHMAKHSGRK